MTNYLDTIAEFAANFQVDAIPAEVTDKTKLILTDSIGAIVGGAAEPEIRTLADRLCKQDIGTSTVIGMGRKADPALAALLNGSAGTFLEMDEGNQFCKGHPGMHTIPACFAQAEVRDISGADFLTAVTIGYEIGARVGIATNLRSAMHPHGTWGAICAAVGLGRMAGFDANKMKTLINISSNMCLATSRPTMLEGGTVRNMYCGISGQLGTLSYNLVEAGFTGEKDGLQNVFGRVVSDSFNLSEMTDNLGSRWEVSRNYFKLHSCCRYNHAALDALEVILQRSEGIENLADIEKIDVETYSLAAELDNQSPANTLAAKFSLPFAIATTLINGSSRVTSFTWEAIENSKIQEMAKRVFVAEDPVMSAKLPDARPASVAITLRSGDVIKAETDTNRGDWRDPYSISQLREKYDSLTERLWNKRDSDAVYDIIMDLDQCASLKQLGEQIGHAEEAFSK